MMGGLAVSEGFAMDLQKEAKDLRERSGNAVSEILKTISMEEVARSDRFDDVMATFPDLKEKFVLAASREKTLQPESPKLQRKPPGFNI
jgi:hypothetical protein